MAEHLTVMEDPVRQIFAGRRNMNPKWKFLVGEVKPTGPQMTFVAQYIIHVLSGLMHTSVMAEAVKETMEDSHCNEGGERVGSDQATRLFLYHWEATRTASSRATERRAFF